MKCFFDGGNEPDSTAYKVVTLAGLVGTHPQWRKFDSDWKKTVIGKHGAQYAHATDATALQNDFANWSQSRVDAMYGDCVRVLREHAAVSHQRLGLLPVTITVLNEDFLRAYETVPELGSSAMHCAVQCCELCFQFGEVFYPDNKYQLYFDQGEPYYGHIVNRYNNRKAKRIEPIWERVVVLAEANMRVTPGLQAADMLAWAVNHHYTDGQCVRDWQASLFEIHREEQLLDYDMLVQPDRAVVERVKAWKLPTRGRPK
jgi:hypothetical protein